MGQILLTFYKMLVAVKKEYNQEGQVNIELLPCTLLGLPLNSTLQMISWTVVGHALKCPGDTTAS